MGFSERSTIILIMVLKVGGREEGLDIECTVQSPSCSPYSSLHTPHLPLPDIAGLASTQHSSSHTCSLTRSKARLQAGNVNIINLPVFSSRLIKKEYMYVDFVKFCEKSGKDYHFMLFK